MSCVSGRYVVSAHIKEKPEHNKVCMSQKCKEVSVH